MKLKIYHQEISSRDQIIEDLKSELIASHKAYEALLIRYARLKERFEELLAIVKQTQRKDSKFKPAQAASALDGEEKIAFEDRPKPPKKPTKIKEKKTSKPMNF